MAKKGRKVTIPEPPNGQKGQTHWKGKIGKKALEPIPNPQAKNLKVIPGQMGRTNPKLGQ